VRPDEDALVVAGPDDVIDAVARLRGHPAFVRRLCTNGTARAVNFATERVLDAWEALLDDELPPSPRSRTTMAIAANGARAAARRVKSWVRP
jgi:hypothetical protein